MQKCSKYTLNAGDPQTGTFQCVSTVVGKANTLHKITLYIRQKQIIGVIFLPAPVSDFVKHLAGTFLGLKSQT